MTDWLLIMKNSVTVGVLCCLIFYDIHRRTVYKKISIKSQMFRKFNISFDKKIKYHQVKVSEFFDSKNIKSSLKSIKSFYRFYFTNSSVSIFSPTYWFSMQNHDSMWFTLVRFKWNVRSLFGKNHIYIHWIDPFGVPIFPLPSRTLPQTTK